MSAFDAGAELARRLRSRVLPRLQAAAPRGSTRRLLSSLDAERRSSRSAVIGALRPPYSPETRNIAGRLHPGVYGYILNQGITRGYRRLRRRRRVQVALGGPHVDWFSGVTRRLVPRILRAVAIMAARHYFRR